MYAGLGSGNLGSLNEIQESLTISHVLFIAQSRDGGSGFVPRLSPTETPPVGYKNHINSHQQSISFSKASMSKAIEDTVALTEEQLRRVLANYIQLQTQFFDITRAVEDGQRTKTDIVRHLAEMKTNIEGIGDHLSSIIPIRLYDEHRSADSTIAHKVLCIPGLLELILEHTSVLDVIKVSETCHELKAVVEA